MDSRYFQIMSERTIIYEPDFIITPNEVMLSWFVIGLTGEAGEVAELVKKGIYHQQGLDREKIKNELGDVLWYVSSICTTLGISLEEVMEMNINKLKARFPDGYEPERTNFKDGKAE